LRLFTFICDSRPVARYVVLCMEACTGVFFSPEKKRRKRKRRNTGKTNLRDLPDSVMQGTPLAVLVLDTLLPSFHIMQYACMPVIYFILYVLFFYAIRGGYSIPPGCVGWEYPTSANIATRIGISSLF